MKRALILVHLLIITAIAYQGVQLGYGLLPAPPSPPAERSLPRETASTSAGDPDHFSPDENTLAAITRRNLFKVQLDKKEVSQPKAPESKPVETLEETRLDLTLLGTVVQTPGKPYAVIREGRSRDQNMFHIGDTIKDAEIRSILRKKVILRYKGKDETLTMAAEKTDKGPPDRTGGAPQLRDSTPGSESEVSLSRSVVDDALGNINKLMGDVRIRPHFTRGKPDGLLLYGIRRDSLFQEMGLKNGDIITGVDGREIQSVEDALTFYEQLKDASDVRVQIKRRGQEKEIQYHVQ